MLQRVFLFLVAVVSLAACQFGSVSVERNADGTADVTVSLTESEANTMIQAALEQSANPLLRNPSVDLQSGQLVISGEHDRKDGGGRVSGTASVTLAVVNGEIQAQVTSATFEGWDVSDARIAEFNQQLAAQLGGRARRDNARATLSSITISDNALNIVVTVQTQG
jgi:regulator of protease activity HflC (stomatin/prohibitin superfamily)